jgi:thioredoxin reductase (NADPH)
VKPPVILAVDDEPAVLRAVARDLTRRYAKDYRIVSAASGAEALAALAELARRGEPVALIVADQRMPELEGTRMLEQAAVHCPDAKTVLLTAYADTQAAIDAINKVGLDHYLMKPWDPPDERMYPILDDLLADWRSSTYLPWAGIRVLGTGWSARTHEIKSFLARQRVPFRYADVDTDAEAAAGARDPSTGALRIPTVILPGGEVLLEPDLRRVAQEIGLSTEAKSKHYDLIVVGAGPAGLAASVYAAAEGLDCLVVERGEIGGLASTSPKIENYLGFPAGIAGADLTRRARDQATRLGAEILSLHEVVGVTVEDPYRVVKLGGGEEITCSALLVATGASFRELPAEGAMKFRGAGIYYAAAHSEAAQYTGQDVLIVGGANSGAQAALLMSRYARRVHMLVRGGSLPASQYLIDAVAAEPKIEVHLDTVVDAIRGDPRIEAVEVTGPAGKRAIPATALFVFVGVKPASDVVRGLCATNAKGFLLTGPQLREHGRWPASWPLDRDPMLLETSVPGIFAVGDVRAGTIGRVAWAAGEGGAAVSMILQYLRGWDAGTRTAVEG